jgi:hypothetical protein
MRLSAILRASLCALVLAVAACENTGTVGTELGAPADLVITTAPDFSGSVSKAGLESANGPAGPYSRHNVWVRIPPAATANAGVVMPTAAPVFVRHDGAHHAAGASDIRVGDRIEVWRQAVPVFYGAVQGPPDAPTYVGIQIVIVR